MTALRKFETGATRDTAEGKPDYEGFLSPLVLEAFGSYMDFNRHLPDGSLRDSDNWQLGIPRDQYVKSAFRHFVDLWKWHRGHLLKDSIVWACCGVIFNVQGFLHEVLKESPDMVRLAREDAEARRAANAAKDALGKLHDDMNTCLYGDDATVAVNDCQGEILAVFPHPISDRQKRRIRKLADASWSVAKQYASDIKEIIGDDETPSNAAASAPLSDDQKCQIKEIADRVKVSEEWVPQFAVGDRVSYYDWFAGRKRFGTVEKLADPYHYVVGNAETIWVDCVHEDELTGERRTDLEVDNRVTLQLTGAVVSLLRRVGELEWAVCIDRPWQTDEFIVRESQIA